MSNTSRGLMVALVMAVLASGTTVQADPDQRCKKVKGEFTSVTIPPPACTSPVGLCTHGILTGKLEGTYDFVATSLYPAPTPENPNRFAYTGESLIETEDGLLFGQDTGFMDFNPFGISPFQTTVNVVGGTEKYERATGSSFIVASGDLTLMTGNATGTLDGLMCFAKH